MLVCTLKHIFTWITTRHSLVWHQLHVHMYVTDRVEEVGSVVCLCMRCVRRRKCSLMDSCTSVGMSGEVWLIFTAASRKPIEPTGSFTFSVAMVTAGCWGLGSRGGRRGGGGGCRGRRSGPQAGPRDGLWKWALARQGSQHSFQEASVRRPSRARPQTTNTPSRRPEEASGDEPRGPETEDHTIWTNRWWLQGLREERERERDKPLGRDFSFGLVLYQWFLYKTWDSGPSAPGDVPHKY